MRGIQSCVRGIRNATEAQSKNIPQLIVFVNGNSHNVVYHFDPAALLVKYFILQSMNPDSVKHTMIISCL